MSLWVGHNASMRLGLVTLLSALPVSDAGSIPGSLASAGGGLFVEAPPAGQPAMVSRLQHLPLWSQNASYLCFVYLASWRGRPMVSSLIGMCYWAHALSPPQAVPAMRFRLCCLSSVVISSFQGAVGCCRCRAAELHECCAQRVQYAGHFLSACSAVRLGPYHFITCVDPRIAAVMSRPLSAGRLLRFTDAFV
jgi:hypothetical protein